MNYKKLDNLFKQARIIAENSKDEETKVGCLIVNKDCETLATGYNGFVRNANDNNLPRARPDKYIYTIHSEVNAIYQAASRGVALKEGICICTLSPCVSCLRALYQCNIRTVYFEKEYRDFSKQLNMKDLIICLTNEGKYTKIEMRGSKNEK